MYLVRHLCFRLLTITYQNEGKIKTLSSPFRFILIIHSSAYLLFNFSPFCFFFRATLLPTFFISCHCFLLRLLSLIFCCLAKNQRCRVKYKGPATVKDCGIIGVSVGRWWITLMTVIIWVFVGPDVPLARAVSSVEANCIIKNAAAWMWSEGL